MAYCSPLSLYEKRQLRPIVATVVVVVIWATIGEAYDSSSRRLHRWEHDLQPPRDDCTKTGQVSRRYDKFELISKRPDTNVQLHIRSNLPVSYHSHTPHSFFLGASFWWGSSGQIRGTYRSLISATKTRANVLIKKHVNNISH